MNNYENEIFEMTENESGERGTFRCHGEHCRHYAECGHTAKTCRRLSDHGPHGDHGSRGEHDFHGNHGPRGERGPRGDHDFRGERGPRGDHGHRGAHHARRPDYLQDDSLRSLLIRSAQSMHHPRAGATQELVLQILSQHDELDAHALRGELEIQPGSLSELIGKLEQKGLVERRRSDDDRRRVTLRLTDAGREALVPAEAQADPFSPLTEEEQSTLRALLTKLLSGSGE